VDFQNSKAAITIISMALLILFSLDGNIWQLNGNSQLKDNDLKYSYIKSSNGTSSEGLKRLEDIFQYHLDKKKIRDLPGKVEVYERKLEETSRKLNVND